MLTRQLGLTACISRLLLDDGVTPDLLAYDEPPVDPADRAAHGSFEGTSELPPWERAVTHWSRTRAVCVAAVAAAAVAVEAVVAEQRAAHAKQVEAERAARVVQARADAAEGAESGLMFMRSSYAGKYQRQMARSDPAQEPPRDAGTGKAPHRPPQRGTRASAGRAVGARAGVLVSCIPRVLDAALLERDPVGAVRPAILYPGPTWRRRTTGGALRQAAVLRAERRVAAVETLTRRLFWASVNARWACWTCWRCPERYRCGTRTSTSSRASCPDPRLMDIVVHEDRDPMAEVARSVVAVAEVVSGMPRAALLDGAAPGVESQLA